MRMGLNSWIHRAEQGAKMRQAGFMLRHASLKKAVNGWMERAFAPDPMHTALMRWANQKLAAAHTKWRDVVAAQREQHERMAAALRKFSPEGRAMTQALNSWKARKDMHRLMLRAGAALFYSKVKKALNNWAFVIEQTYRMQESARALMNAKLQRAFNSWLQAPPHPMKKVLARMINGPLAKAFASWVEVYDGMLRAHRALSHLVNRGLSKGLRSWLEYLELLDVMQRAMSGMRNNGLQIGRAHV